MKTFKNYVSTLEDEKLNEYFFNEAEPSNEIDEGLGKFLKNLINGLNKGTEKVVKGLGKTGENFAKWAARMQKIRNGEIGDLDDTGKELSNKLKKTEDIDDGKELLKTYMDILKDDKGEDYQKCQLGVATAMNGLSLAQALKDDEATKFFKEYIKKSPDKIKAALKKEVEKENKDGGGKDNEVPEKTTQALDNLTQNAENVTGAVEDDDAKKKLEEQVENLKKEIEEMKKASKTKEEEDAKKIWEETYKNAEDEYKSAEEIYNEEEAPDELKRSSGDNMYTALIIMKTAAEKLGDEDRQKEVEEKINKFKEDNKEAVEQAAKDSKEVDDKAGEGTDKVENPAKVSVDDDKGGVKNLSDFVDADDDLLNSVRDKLGAMVEHLAKYSSLEAFVKIFEGEDDSTIRSTIKDMLKNDNDSKDVHKALFTLFVAYEKLKKLKIDKDDIKAVLDGYDDPNIDKKAEDKK